MAEIPWLFSEIEQLDVIIQWKQNIPITDNATETLVAIATKDSNRVRKLAANFKLLSQLIENESEWLETAEYIPFFVLPTSQFMSQFKGIGTNSLEHAKRYCLFALAAQFWNAAVKEKFGTEFMVKNLAACLRCYTLAGENNMKTIRSDLDPDAANLVYYQLTKIIIDLSKYNIMTRPPMQCTNSQLLDCMSVLNSALAIIHNIIAPSKLVPHIKRLKDYLIKELHLIVGVFISQELALPFSTVPSQGYLSVKDTARLLMESCDCLEKAHGIAIKYKNDVQLKLRSGYSTEYRGPLTFSATIQTPGFWNHQSSNKKLSAFIIQDSPENMISKILIMADL